MKEVLKAVGNDDVEKEFSLDAPCIFCGYNGPGYWQAGIHDRNCPFNSIAGELERYKALRAIVKVLAQKHCLTLPGEESDDDVLELTEQLSRKPTVETALDIMCWELGDMQKMAKHLKWYPQISPGFNAEMKSALASLLFQSLVVARLKGWLMEDLFQLGFDTVKERIADYQMKLGRFQYYVGDK